MAKLLETNQAFKKSAAEGNRLIQLDDEQTAKIQAVLLNMLMDFDGICRKYGLTYVLFGGSALGAVRHKGFIPWDDDLDVGMPRADYDRLPGILEKEYASKFWVQNIMTDEKYDLGFMKIRKVGTKFLEIFDTEPEKSGFFIDIYPIENLPDSGAARKFYCFVEDLLQFCASCVRIRFKQERLKEFVAEGDAGKAFKIKSAIGKILSFRSLYSWCRSADRWASRCRNERSVYVGVPVGRNHSFKEVYLRDRILPGCEGEFEKKIIQIPSDPCYYLKMLFGDYMKIPDVSERERHSILEIKY